MKSNKCNYVFLDESGKPEVYSAKGINLVQKGQATKFLVLAAVRTNDQLLIQQQVTDFKLTLLKDDNLKRIFSSAYTLDAFHAQSDYPIIRERFYKFINTLNVKIDVMVVDKLNCFEQLKRNPGKLYGVMAGQLLKNICHQSNKTEIIFSRKDSKLKLRQELEYEVERVRIEYLQNHQNLQAQFIVSYQHNPHYTHGGLQIADYIAYAVFQVYENKNINWYEIDKKNSHCRPTSICASNNYFQIKNIFLRKNPINTLISFSLFTTQSTHISLLQIQFSNFIITIINIWKN